MRFAEAYRGFVQAIERFRGVVGGVATRVFTYRLFIPSKLSYIFQFGTPPPKLLSRINKKAVLFITKTNLCKMSLMTNLGVTGVKMVPPEAEALAMACQLRAHNALKKKGCLLSSLDFTLPNRWGGEPSPLERGGETLGVIYILSMA